MTGTDAAGNTSAPVEYSFRLDTLAPTAEAKSPTAGATAVDRRANVTAQLSEAVDRRRLRRRSRSPPPMDRAVPSDPVLLQRRPPGSRRSTSTADLEPDAEYEG